MTGSLRLTDDDIFKMAKEGYLYELGMLVQIVKSSYFRNLLPFFGDYENFLAAGRSRYLGNKLLSTLLEKNRVINAATVLSTGRKLFACANLAACCEIFGGWTVPVADLKIEHTGEYLRMALDRGGDKQSDLGRNMAIRLNNGDAVRVVQTLKLLGLLATDSSCYNQLSLGASIGRRDSHAFHLTPWIASPHPGHEPDPQSPLRFGVKPHNTANIVLMDNDPALKPVYAMINEKEEGRVQAMNLDFNEGIQQISRSINGGLLQHRNLVVAFRLEPQAFPDVRCFLESLGGVIGETAGFVTTIGAGNNADEFEHRLEVLDALDEALSGWGMKPVRIKCYQGKTHNEQRNSPLFGLRQYASYEILFCKLERARLV